MRTIIIGDIHGCAAELSALPDMVFPGGGRPEECNDY